MSVVEGGNDALCQGLLIWDENIYLCPLIPLAPSAVALALALLQSTAIQETRLTPIQKRYRVTRLLRKDAYIPELALLKIRTMLFRVALPQVTTYFIKQVNA
ncbi:MAG: hypothetical protein EOO38_15785 [Cytophagaceae bacterium]|nr:MAG: hypothetical protein EOO38_15785 [Cytophagaceae bacterium]